MCLAAVLLPPAPFTMATYVHASAEDLAAGRDARAAIYRAEGSE